MSASLDGFNVAVTGQNAGKGRARADSWPGVSNAPASRASTDVMVAFGNASFATASHDPFAMSGRSAVAAASTNAHTRMVACRMTTPCRRAYALAVQHDSVLT